VAPNPRDNISPIDPDTLRDPRGEVEAMVAHCHAFNQMALITEELARLRKLKRRWRVRDNTCRRELGRVKGRRVRVTR
jgi:hypothetical protein